MIKLIEAKDFEEFVNEVVKAANEGYVRVGNIKSSALGLGPKTKMATFDILTKECGKTYVARGVSGMAAIVADLASNGREIRSVTPVSVYKDRILSSGFTCSMMKEPVRVKVESVYDNPSEDSMWGRFLLLKTSEVESENLEENVDDLTNLSKKELVAMCKDLGLTGNIQETKKVLIARIEGEANG